MLFSNTQNILFSSEKCKSFFQNILNKLQLKKFSRMCLTFHVETILKNWLNQNLIIGTILENFEATLRINASALSV